MLRAPMLRSRAQDQASIGPRSNCAAVQHRARVQDVDRGGAIMKSSLDSSRRSRRVRRRLAWIGSWLLGLGVALGPAGGQRADADELKKSGTIEIEQVQIAFIGSGNLGGG